MGSFCDLYQPNLDIQDPTTLHSICLLTFTGGVAPVPECLRIWQPFWLGLCGLLFSWGFFTVPPWSFLTESTFSAVVLLKSWWRHTRQIKVASKKVPLAIPFKLKVAILSNIVCLREIYHRAVGIWQELSKLRQQIFLVFEETSHLSIHLLFRQSWSVVSSSFLGIPLFFLKDRQKGQMILGGLPLWILYHRTIIFWNVWYG